MTRRFKRKLARHGERGYLMVGLVATMTISLIMLAAAAPQLQFQSQREREEEMLWRGQEISDALNNWCADHGSPGGCVAPQVMPRRLEELVEGTKIGLDQKRYLRPHALCDPLLPCSSGKSNWRLVHPGDPVIGSMLETLKAYQDKLPANDPRRNVVARNINFLARFAPQVNLPGEVSQGGLSSGLGIAPVPNPNDPQNPGTLGEGQSGNGLADAKPIVGVVSRSKERPIRSMLDVENYDKELFFAGGVVMAGGFVSHYGSFGGGAASGNNDGGCPPQLVLPSGGCAGKLYDGKAPPKDRPTK